MLPLVKRFVAGLTQQEALERTRRIQELGLLTSLDYLGEHLRDPEAAEAVTEEYVTLLENIARDKDHPSYVSPKLTHLGLDISDQTALANMREILAVAKKHENFVRIDMEGSPYTERTLDIFRTLHAEFSDHVGIVIQAYLYRSTHDIEELAARGARVRLCKGAYKEPPNIAFRDKRGVDQNYDRLCEALMREGTYPAIATHDPQRIRNAIAYARKYGKSPRDFEFQMLLGITNKMAVDLAKSGWRVRIYLPYGRQWLGYFYRRLRERKENFFFVLNNLFRG